MNTILKVECDGDLRRALLNGTPSYSAIDGAIQEIWPGRSAQGAKYMDEEGDACTLTELTFDDFLDTACKAANGNLLRLHLPVALTPQTVAHSNANAFSRPWERVEQSSEPGEEHLHTVADLTDVQGEEESAQECEEEQRAAADLPQPQVEKDAQSMQEVGEAGQEIVGAQEDLAKQETSQDDAAEPQHQYVVAEGSGYSPRHLEPMPGDATVKNEPEGLAASVASDDATCSAEVDLGTEEKIDIVIAAFDENGDGHLNFAETIALHRAAWGGWGGRLSLESFAQMCADEGEDPEVGLGRESLMCVYSRCRTLERDFEAAKGKLEGRREQSPAHPIKLVLKNPSLAIPFAEDATERLCRGVASTFKRRS